MTHTHTLNGKVMQYIAMMYTEESWLDYGTMAPLIFGVYSWMIV